MKKVIWLIEDREIPNVGLAEKDKRITLPDKMAKEFVERKYARYPKKSKKE